MHLRAVFILASLMATGCQVSYLLKNSWHQTKILKSRIPIQEVLADPRTPEPIKAKLQLVDRARKFAIHQLGLKKSENYTSYVDLKRDYVTWVVRASPKWKLEPYQWWFPITGSVPYKGYFTKDGAKDEAENLKVKDYDTYVRGVTAYSTLGWFEDPVLNTMIKYNDYDLVNLIIHETVHATIFIKGHVDFNERLATFVGNLGAEKFYQNDKNGDKILQQVEKENQDLVLFSSFITKELNNLKAWYTKHSEKDLQQRAQRLDKIKQRFATELQPNLKTDRFLYFKELTLNNAVLLSYETYQANLDTFQKLYDKLGRNFQALIDYCKTLESADDPQIEIERFVSK